MSLRTQLYEDRIKQTEYVSHEQAAKLEIIFEQNEKIANEIIANEITLKTLQTATTSTSIQNTTQLFDSFNINQDYSAIYLIDKSGLTIVSTNPSFIGKNYGFRNYFRKAIEGKPHVEFALGTTSGEPGYYLSYPIQSQSSIEGVLVIKISPEAITNSVFKQSSKIHNPNVNNIYLTDEYGIIMFDLNHDNELKSVSQLNPNQTKRIQATKQYGTNIETLGLKGLSEAINTVNDYKTVDITNPQGQKVPYSIHRVDNLEFFVIAETEIDDIDTYVLQSTFGIIILVIIAGTIAIIIISAYLNTTLKNLEKLTNAIENFKKDGTLMSTNTVKSNDEIERLANAFNEMSRQLQEEKEKIEEKVKNRTKELEKINYAMVGRELKMIELKKELKELKKKKKTK